MTPPKTRSRGRDMRGTHEPMILGLWVAALWGVGDLLAAVAARRVDSFTTLVVAQATELAVSVALTAWLRPAVDPSTMSIVTLLVTGGLTALAYGCLYRGLMLGPVALVTPIASAYAVGPILLAVVVLDERLSSLGAIGATATVLGVGTVTARSHRESRADVSYAGIPFAFGAMVTFAVSAFLIAALAADVGWLGTLLVSRIGVMIALSLSVVGVPRFATVVHADLSCGRGIAPFLIAVLAGGCNLAGTAVFAQAGRVGSVAVTSAASALFPLVPIVGGLVMFRERLTRVQLAGAATIVLGLIVLGSA